MSSHVPTGLRPWLALADATAAVDFYQRAWGATIVNKFAPNGRVEVAELDVDGARFWVQQDDQDHAVDGRRASGATRTVLVVDDPAHTLAIAVDAGATLVTATHDEHSWRTGRVVDPFGHHWEIAALLEHG